MRDEEEIKGQSESIINFKNEDQPIQIDMGHPSRHLRGSTTEIERQNININAEYGSSILNCLREIELQFLTNESLIRHKITAPLRGRMVDWKIEVLTNFKCDD